MYGAEVGLSYRKHAATCQRRPVILFMVSHGCSPRCSRSNHGSLYLSWSGITQGWSIIAISTKLDNLRLYHRRRSSEGFKLLSRLKALSQLLSLASAIALAQKVAAKMSPDQSLIVSLSGRGVSVFVMVKERSVSKQKGK